MAPWAMEAITAFHAFPNVRKYLINLTDHAFWLGTSCTDYLVEFRNYGINVSRSKRGLPLSAILF